MMLEVVHETRYAYGARVDLAQHLAHLRPRTLPQQRVEAVELAIEPPPQHWTRGIDVFGNGRDGFALYAPHEALSVTARSRVALQAVASVDGRADAGAAWDEVAARCSYRAGAPFEAASEFVFESPFVPELAALRDYGAPSFAPGRSLPQAAHELMQRIRADFTYDGNATEVHTPLAQVFAARRDDRRPARAGRAGALRQRLPADPAAARAAAPGRRRCLARLGQRVVPALGLDRLRPHQCPVARRRPDPCDAGLGPRLRRRDAAARRDPRRRRAQPDGGGDGAVRRLSASAAGSTAARRPRSYLPGESSQAAASR
jgi:hypothetical protein